MLCSVDKYIYTHWIEKTRTINNSQTIANLKPLYVVCNFMSISVSFFVYSNFTLLLCVCVLSRSRSSTLSDKFGAIFQFVAKAAVCYCLSLPAFRWECTTLFSVVAFWNFCAHCCIHERRRKAKLLECSAVASLKNGLIKKVKIPAFDSKRLFRNVWNEKKIYMQLFFIGAEKYATLSMGFCWFDCLPAAAFQLPNKNTIKFVNSEKMSKKTLHSFHVTVYVLSLLHE